jgi:transposase-like protein
MFKEHNKITTGYVIQNYITLPNGTLVCVGQEFIAGDQVDYENDVSEPVTVDVDKEVYCPFEMKQPKQLPDPENAVKFVCPDCGDTRLEVIMDGDHTTAIEGMFKSGSVEYGDTESAGFVERFQCVGCGFTIKDEADETIKDDDEVTEWCKENCNQE